MVVYERVILLNTKNTWLHDAFERHRQQYHRPLVIGQGPCHLSVTGLPDDQDTLEKALGASTMQTLVICMYREPVGRHIAGFLHDLEKHVPNWSSQKTLEQQCAMVASIMEAKMKANDFWELYQPLSAEWRRKPNEAAVMNPNTDLLWLRFDEAQGVWEKVIRKLFPFFRPIINIFPKRVVQVSRPEIQVLWEHFLRNNKSLQSTMCKDLMDGRDKAWFEFFYEEEDRARLKKQYHWADDPRSTIAKLTLKRMGVRR